MCSEYVELDGIKVERIGSNGNGMEWRWKSSYWCHGDSDVCLSEPSFIPPDLILASGASIPFITLVWLWDVLSVLYRRNECECFIRSCIMDTFVPAYQMCFDKDGRGRDREFAQHHSSQMKSLWLSAGSNFRVSTALCGSRRKRVSIRYAEEDKLKPAVSFYYTWAMEGPRNRNLIFPMCSPAWRRAVKNSFNKIL